MPALCCLVAVVRCHARMSDWVCLKKCSASMARTPFFSAKTKSSEAIGESEVAACATIAVKAQAMNGRARIGMRGSLRIVDGLAMRKLGRGFQAGMAASPDRLKRQQAPPRATIVSVSERKACPVKRQACAPANVRTEGGRQNRVARRCAMVLPTLRAEVAAGEGQLMAWTMRGCSSMAKSSTSLPSGATACARTPAGAGSM